MKKNESKDTNQGQLAFAPPLLPPKQAAVHLSVALTTLNNSRYTGLLCSVSAPAYIKRGSSVFYKRETLEKWNSQFKEQHSTSESVA